jgi:hypothetical protein
MALSTLEVVASHQSEETSSSIWQRQRCAAIALGPSSC